MPYTALRNYHLYLDIPTPIFRARLNMPGTIPYPVTALTFDTVTLGAYTAIVTDMTLILGSTLGADDLGRVRVQNVATSTTIPVGYISQGIEDGTLTISDNAYVEVWEDFRVWARIPREIDGVFYKDADYGVGDFMTEIPPVSNCGVGTGDYINSGTSLITVTFPDGGADLSFAMADGATISTYNWDVKDGTITVGTSASAVITATFPAGRRWVALTVTDSNGKSHTSRCLVVAINPASDVTIPFKVESFPTERKGQTLSFRILDDRLRTTYPDGCAVLLWHDTPVSASNRNHVDFFGYHQTDSFTIRATPQGNIRETVLNCLDVAGRLDTLPGFPQALERGEGEANEAEEIVPNWAYMPTLTLRKAIHYLGYWHSTAFALADLILPDALEDYPSMRLDSTGSSLYDQINSRAQSAVPDYWLTCDWQGRLHVVADWMLLDVADRPVSTAGTLGEDNWSDLKVDYARPPKIYALRSSAVVCSEDWLIIGGEETLPLAFCIAPGNAFGQGVAESVTGEKLTPSQEVLNHCEGHRWARLNARYGPFSITEPTGEIQNFQPALMLPVGLNISAATAAQRGLDFTTTRGLATRIDRRFNETPMGTWVQPTITFEREVFGVPAVTVIPEVPDDPEYETPPPPLVTVPPGMGLRAGVENVVGIGSDGYVYKTADFQTVSGSGGPTWTRVDTTIADTIYSFVVDPFSPGYAAGATTGAINGWIVNDTDIYRVADLFGTPIATSVLTFPVATVAASFHWRTIQASFGAYFAAGVNPWLLCVSYYGDTSGHTGTWATRSTDGGVTWSAEVQVSAFYDAVTSTRFNPIAVFTSPRTPGKAYTAAYGDLVDDPTNPLPRWALWRNLPAASGLEVMGLNGSFTATATAEEDGVVAGTTQTDFYMILAPPKDAARVVVSGTYVATREEDGSSTSTSGSLGTIANSSNTSHTEDLTYTQPANPDGTSSDTFTIEWTKSGVLDWNINSESIVSSPPGTVQGCRIRLNAVANAAGTPGPYALYQITLTLTVTEIELEGGYTYVPATGAGGGMVSTDWGASWAGTALIAPGDALAGSIHLPWPSNPSESLIYYGNADFAVNREFRLKQSASGVITDISPVDTGVSFGANRGPFGIRTYDGNRNHLLLAGIGNDTTVAPADDLHGVFYSDDAGATWTTVVAPMADTEAPAGRPALEAAFGGDSELIQFYWGAENYISYTSNAGVAVDSRAGNLSSFGSVYLIGIAGGST